MTTQRTASQRTVRFVVVPVIALAASAGLIWRASYAAFDRSTPRSTATPGQVDLTDDANGVALFHPDGPVAPGSTGTQCIRVTSSAGDPGEVRMYLTDLVDTAHGLQDHLMITVVQGDGGGSGTCDGFVPDAAGDIIARQSFAEAAATFSGYASGAGAWATHGNTTGESKTYRITWDFDTTGMSPAAEQALMGDTTGLGFQWELQSV